MLHTMFQRVAQNAFCLTTMQVISHCRSGAGFTNASPEILSYKKIGQKCQEQKQFLLEASICPPSYTSEAVILMKKLVHVNLNSKYSIKNHKNSSNKSALRMFSQIVITQILGHCFTKSIRVTEKMLNMIWRASFVLSSIQHHLPFLIKVWLNV